MKFGAMKTLFFFLCLIGLGCALQKDMFYKYHYSGRLGTGAPKMRSQVAGTGIDFDVYVQMTSEKEATIKFHNVQVGEYHGDVSCDMRHRMPIQFHPLPDKFKDLEVPFHVYFLEQEGHIADVLKDEVEWMTNIRRSVVNHLRSAPLRANMGKRDDDPAFDLIHAMKEKDTAPNMFIIEEDTIVGRCPSEYTITKLGDYHSHMEYNNLRKRLDEDSEYKDDNKHDLWKVIRTINFDECQDTAMLNLNGFGNETHSNRGHLSYMQSRTQLTQYILRGTPGHFRFERGMCEGSYTLETYGYKSEGEELQVVTNQTMHLLKVQDAASAPEVGEMALPGDLEPVNTWKYSIISPYGKPEGNVRSWVHYLNKPDEMPLEPESVVTGIRMTPERVEEYKNAFMVLFEQAIEEMMKDPEATSDKHVTPFNTHSGRAAYLFERAAFYVHGLNIPQVQEVFEHFYNKDSGEKGDLEKMFIVDVIAESGTRAAAHVLLEKFMEKKITSTRAATVFMTYTNNIVEPEIFHEGVEFLKKLDLKEYPFFASSAFINFAQMARRQCVSEHYKNYTIPSPALGDHTCSRREVIDELLPFYKERIYAASTSWERAIYAQAIGNLGVSEAIHVMKPFIYGNQDMNPRVRTTAIFSLASWKLPEFCRYDVFETLMYIVDNVGEEPQVRQAALKVLLSWRPDSSWWQRMAAMSWHEPSRQMAAFIYSTIHSVSQFDHVVYGRQVYMAKHALHLAKPIIPSLRYSYNFQVSEFNKESELFTAAEIGWISNQESVIPREVEYYFNMRLGGFEYKLFDVVFQSDGLQEPLFKFLDFMRGIVEPSSTEHNLHNSGVRNAQEIYQKFIDAVQMENYNRHHPEATLFMKFFDNMQHYFIFNKEVFQQYYSSTPSILSEMAQGKRIHMTKFMNPSSIITAVASEVGLPIISTTFAPMIHMAEGKIKLNVEGHPEPSFMDILMAKKVDVDFDIKYKIVTKVNTMFEAFVPWDEKTVGAVLDAERQVNLPLKAKVEYNREGEDNYFKWTVQPTVSHKFPVFYAHNVPYTFIDKMGPHTDYTNMDYKIVYMDMQHDKPYHRVEKEHYGTKFTGIETEFIWEGDVDYPFEFGHVYDFMRHPERLVTTLGGVDGRNWFFSANIDPSKSDTKQIVYKFSVMPRFTQADHTPSNDGFSVDDSNAQRYQKIIGLNHVEHDQEYVGFVRAELSFTGGENRKYDANFAYWRDPKSTQESSKAFFTVMRSGFGDYPPQAVCSIASAQSPKITFYDDMETVLKNNPEVKVQGELRVSPDCLSGKVADVDVHFHLSDEHKARLEWETHHDTCSNHKYNCSINNFPHEAHYDMVDGHFNFEQDMPSFMRNFTYILGDKIRGFYFPEIYYNYMDVNHPEGKFDFHAYRPAESHYWKFYGHLPHRDFIVERAYIPEIVDTILPIGGVQTPVKRFNQIFLRSPWETNKCTIDNNHHMIRTFDHHEYELKEFLPCWTVVAKDRSEPDSWVLETRVHGGKLEARFTSKTRSSVIDMTEDEVKVNDEVIKPEGEQVVRDVTGHVFAKIINKHGKWAVEIPYKISGMIKDGKFKVYSSLRYKGMMSGLCGDYNEDEMYDFQGPKHCLYRDTELFMKSWVSEDTDCPNYAAYQDEVHQFQDGCHKAPTHNYQPYITAEYKKDTSYCKHYYYSVYEREDEFCVMKSPMPVCDDDCHTVYYEKSMANYKCWPKSEAPAEVKSAYPSPGYVKEPVKVDGKTIRYLPVKYSRECSRNH